MNNKNSYTTDWLGSMPVYYNEKTGVASHHIYDVIDIQDIEIHPEGFNNFIEFGYSVLGQTPLNNVKYLSHSSTLSIDKNKQVHIENLPDITEDYLTRTTNEKDVWELIAHKVRHWEKTTEGPIILPLSGGFDSRILAYFINDKSRIRAFTYGTSNNQSRSFEVINARRLAHNLDIAWEQVTLSNYYDLIQEWEAIYGIATHAHGMYQMQFYKKIAALVTSGTVVSGIIGDAWAGSVKIPQISSPDEITTLGYSHGMNADVTKSLIRCDNNLRNQYFSEHKDKLADSRWRVIESMRFKMVLLSYLTNIPRQLGYNVWAPFLDAETALSMLTLPEDRKANRAWQRDFFAKYDDLQLESHWFKDRKNTLNLKTLEHTTLPPLRLDVLSNVVETSYVKNINDRLQNASQTLAQKRMWGYLPSLLYNFPILHTWPDKYHLDNYHLDCEESRALNAYLVLHPLQTMLEKRETSYG